jgi:hypothetical protein
MNGLECCFTWHCRPGRDDAKAADALYWATRLEPTWADAYYARRIAMHLGDPQRLRRYWLGDQGTIESGDIRRIDSLYYRARTIDPFVSQRLERRLFEAVADEIAKEHAGDPAQVRVIVEQEMNSWPGRTAPGTPTSTVDPLKQFDSTPTRSGRIVTIEARD